MDCIQDLTHAKNRLVRDYLIAVIALLATFGVANVIILQHMFPAYLFGGLVVLFMFSLFFDLYKRKWIQYISVLCSILLVYYFGIDRFQSHVNIFYIVIFFAIIFLFDFKADRFKVISLLIVMVALFSINTFTRFLDYGRPFFTENQYRSLFIITLVYFVVFLVLTITYTTKMMRTVQQYTNGLQQVSAQQSTGKLGKDIVSLEEVNDLKQELFEDHRGFINHFQLLFPIFYQRIREFRGLSHSDLELMAFMKLNFTTGEIAMVTNSSLKSVESKKYRLRKKLNIPREQNLYTWIQDI